MILDFQIVEKNHEKINLHSIYAVTLKNILDTLNKDWKILKCEKIDGGNKVFFKNGDKELVIEHSYWCGMDDGYNDNYAHLNNTATNYSLSFRFDKPKFFMTKKQYIIKMISDRLWQLYKQRKIGKQEIISRVII